jgi:hypothetical protein
MNKKSLPQDQLMKIDDYIAVGETILHMLKKSYPQEDNLPLEYMKGKINTLLDIWEVARILATSGRSVEAHVEEAGKEFFLLCMSTHLTVGIKESKKLMKESEAA